VKTNQPNPVVYRNVKFVVYLRRLIGIFELDKKIETLPDENDPAISSYFDDADVWS